MIMDMSVETFLSLHVDLSLIGIASGFVVIIGMFRSKQLNGWAALFLATTILTSATGFFLPSAGFGPSQAIGLISLVILSVALVGLYVYKLAGSWRWLYVVSAVVALYLNVFVSVVQAFRKVPSLAKLAPTQTEMPFVLAQASVLTAFVVICVVAIRLFHPVINSSHVEST